MEKLKFEQTVCLTQDEINTLVKEVEGQILMSQDEVDEFIEQLKFEINQKEAA